MDKLDVILQNMANQLESIKECEINSEQEKIDIEDTIILINNKIKKEFNLTK